MSVRVASKEKETSVTDPTESTPNLDDKQSFSEIIGPTLDKLPSDITDQQRHQIVEFLQEYDDMFSRGTFDMGRTTLVEHSIDTGQNRPIRQALRRHPRAHLDEIDRQVDELQESGFVEPASSSTNTLLHNITGSIASCYKFHRHSICLRPLNNVALFTTITCRFNIRSYFLQNFSQLSSVTSSVSDGPLTQFTPKLPRTDR